MKNQTINYFAYGSNMLTRRLRERIPSSRSLGRARLDNHQLAWTKRSFRDGSGKCHIIEAEEPGQVVWGVLFEMNKKEQTELDRIEGRGYTKKSVTVAYDSSTIAAYTYHATAIKNGLRPFHWYKSLVLAGAREHDLPPEYIREMERVNAINDRNRSRSRKVEHLVP